MCIHTHSIHRDTQNTTHRCTYLHTHTQLSQTHVYTAVFPVGEEQFRLRIVSGPTYRKTVIANLFSTFFLVLKMYSLVDGSFVRKI